MPPSQSQIFWEGFIPHRNINREFFARVPEEKFDFRMVDTPERKSDSPRESLAHQIYVTYKYMFGVETGTLEFDGITTKNLTGIEKLSKEELLRLLDESTTDLENIVKDPATAEKTVRVPWNPQPLPAIISLFGLHDHEILHTGWNLALMDHLNIDRFPQLEEIWG